MCENEGGEGVRERGGMCLRGGMCVRVCVRDE